MYKGLKRDSYTYVKGNFLSEDDINGEYDIDGIILKCIIM